MHVTAWDSAFGKLGWISSQSKALTPLVTGWTAAILIHAMAATPQVALLLWFGLAAESRVYEEQALIDASRSTVFWRITLRRMLPLIVLSAVWIFITCSREIAVTDIYQIGTLAEQIYLGYSLGQMGGSWTPEQIAAAQTTSTLLTCALIFCLASATILIANKYFVETTSSETSNKSSVLQRGSTGKNIAGIVMLILIAVIPLTNLLVRGSFFVQSIDGKPTPGYSLSHLTQAISNILTKNQSEIIWSTLIASASAILLLVVAILFAWFARRSTKVGWLFLISIALTAALPGPLIGTIVVKTFSTFDNDLVIWLFDRTILPAVIAVFLFCWPISSVLTWFSLKNTPVDTLEHASLEGASQSSQLLQLGVFGNLTSLVGCLLITFAVCFGELSASHMTLPPGIDTVPRLALGWLHAGVNEMTAALTIVTVTLIVGISVLGWSLVCLKESQNYRK